METFFAAITTILVTWWIWIPILVVLSPVWLPFAFLVINGMFGKDE